jgi:transposase-like protein
MPRSRKIDMEKVLACMDTVCPKCGKTIPPAEVQQRLDFTRIKCPTCAEAFVPNNGGAGKKGASA